MEDEKTELADLFVDLDDIALKQGMTKEQYLELLKSNNPEIDWGEPKGDEI